MSPAPFAPSGRTIPTEILMLVVSFYDPEHDASILARLARCSHVCHQVVIPVLYSHLHLYSDRQIDLLLDGVSIDLDVKGRPVPGSSLGDIVVGDSSPRRRASSDPYAMGRGTRKLSHLSFVRYVSLHFFPKTEYLSPNHAYRRSGAVILLDNNNEREVIRLFPSAGGMAIGKGYLVDLTSRMNVDHSINCSDPEHNDVKPQLSLWRTCPFDLQRDSSHLKRLTAAWGSDTEMCHDLTFLPSGPCPQSVRQVFDVLERPPGLDRIGGFRVSHSVFPSLPLSTWPKLQSLRNWRHFIHVEAAWLNARDVSNVEDLSHTDKLDDLVFDLYDFAVPYLFDICEGVTIHCRHDFVLSGLTAHQVRELEQRFIRVIEAEFPKPRFVIVDPTLPTKCGYHCCHRWKDCPGPLSDSDSEPEDDDSELQDDDDYNNHRNRQNWYDEYDEDSEVGALRDNLSKRVVMFDFLHTSEAAVCASCGAGEGPKIKATRGRWGRSPGITTYFQYLE